MTPKPNQRKKKTCGRLFEINHGYKYHHPQPQLPQPSKPFQVTPRTLLYHLLQIQSTSPYLFSLPLIPSLGIQIFQIFMAKIILIILLVPLLSLLSISGLVVASPSAATFDVVGLGAKPDGNTDSTKAFLSAWSQACGSVNPAVIYVPVGRFLLRNVVFSGQCKNSEITFRIAGTLVAPSDYGVIGNEGNWLMFDHVNGVTISGGILDGQGTALWACKSSGKSGCPSGATVIIFVYIVIFLIVLYFFKQNIME